MKILIIILMFLVTVFTINIIAENGKAVRVEDTVTGFRHLTSASCISIAIIATAFDAACLYMLVKVV